MKSCQPRVLDKVDQWLSRWLPRQCLLCGLDSGRRSFCRGCRDDLPWLGQAYSRCCRPLPAGGSAGRCGHCDLELAGVARYRAALVYEYPVDRLLTAAKFERRPEYARGLGDLLASTATAWLGDFHPDCLVPVPLHPLRLARRGFNQAVEIATPLARALRLPVAARACRRRRNTPAQTRLSGAARRSNPVRAFACRGPLGNLRVAIVDDVVTTGSTASSLARALRAAGAEAVEVWSVARVVAQAGAKV